MPLTTALLLAFALIVIVMVLALSLTAMAGMCSRDEDAEDITRAIRDFDRKEY